MKYLKSIFDESRQLSVPAVLKEKRENSIICWFSTGIKIKNKVWFGDYQKRRNKPWANFLEQTLESIQTLLPQTILEVQGKNSSFSESPLTAHNVGGTLSYCCLGYNHPFKILSIILSKPSKLTKAYTDLKDCQRMIFFKKNPENNEIAQQEDWLDILFIWF